MREGGGYHTHAARLAARLFAAVVIALVLVPAAAAQGVTPTVTGIDPASGPTTGGTLVTITGTGFSGATSVRFGEAEAAYFAVSSDPLSSDTKMVAESPLEQPPGTVHVTVTNPEGVSPQSDADRFTYFSPTGGKWTDAGSLTFGAGLLYSHTATLLPNGKVLVAGGCCDAGFKARSAELYDPETGNWSVTEKMNAPRQEHTATLLPNGKVLVAGGNTRSSESDARSSELYDPATGRWTPTRGSLRDDRYNHTATLLGNGEVLVAGGMGADTGSDLQINVSSAEIYNPASDTWRVTGSLSEPRAWHTATLLSGPNCGLNCGRVLVVGGWKGHRFEHVGTGEATAEPELYDPTSGLWIRAPSPEKRDNHTATLMPDGRLMVAGGDPHPGGPICSTEVFDPVSNFWSRLAALNICRTEHIGALLPNGKFLAAGGGGQRSAELFDPAAAPGGQWRFVSPMSTERRSAEAVLLSSSTARFEADQSACGENCGKVLVVGGPPSAELYTPAPEVTGLSPGSGPADGGTQVVLTGTGFTHRVEAVTFGGVPARSFSVSSYGQLTAVSPPHASGMVDVVVTNEGGASSPGLATKFTYTPVGVGVHGVSRA